MPNVRQQEVARCSSPAISASRIAEADIRPEAYDPKLDAGFAPPPEQDLTPARFGDDFAATAAGRLGPVVCGRLEDLLSRPNVLAELKSDPGPLGLDTLLAEIGKLSMVRALGLTEAVFGDASDRGAGKNRVTNRLWLSSSLNTCKGVIVTITDWMAAWRRERRVLQRVSRAAWRLEQAERERAWALASARAEGVSIRKLAAAAGLSPARVHQITAAADLDELDAALGELRAAGWPAPEDPDGDDDGELDGRDLICDRLLDEVGWLRQCADWLTHLHTSEYPPAVNLRPDGDHPGRALVVADLPRVAVILQRIAADVDELARARRVADLGAAAALPDRRAERRRRVAEPELDFREFCRRNKLPQSERSWDLFAAERYRRGETGTPSYEADNPFRRHQQGTYT